MGKKFLLYFLPGIVPTLMLLAIHRIYGEKLPSITILMVIDFLVTIPLMIYIISEVSGQPFGLGIIKDIFKSQTNVSFWPLAGLTLCSLLWAIGCFVLLKPVTEFLGQHVFGWIPDWFSPGLFPDKQDPSILRLSWLMMIPFSIIMPFMEEVYFRGFLLPKEPYDDWRAPLINTVLFCAYHIWSPQVFVTRVVATFPMNYLVWKYKNIYLSIIPHVLLNLIGDVFLMYPLVFR